MSDHFFAVSRLDLSIPSALRMSNQENVPWTGQGEDPQPLVPLFFFGENPNVSPPEIPFVHDVFSSMENIPVPSLLMFSCFQMFPDVYIYCSEANSLCVRWLDSMVMSLLKVYPEISSFIITHVTWMSSYLSFAMD